MLMECRRHIQDRLTTENPFLRDLISLNLTRRRLPSRCPMSLYRFNACFLSSNPLVSVYQGVGITIAFCPHTPTRCSWTCRRGTIASADWMQLSFPLLHVVCRWKGYLSQEMPLWSMPQTAFKPHINKFMIEKITADACLGHSTINLWVFLIPWLAALFYPKAFLLYEGSWLTTEHKRFGNKKNQENQNCILK